MGASKQRKDARKRRAAQGFAPGYTIGITLFVKADGDLGLFENGLRQNVLFLYLLFKNSPNCARVYLLNHGDGDNPQIPEELGIEPGAVVRTHQVIDQLDYVIGAGAAIDRETAMALRQRGCRMICYKGGNGAIISIEAMAAKPQRGDAELYFDHDYYDAIWMTPQHIHTYRGWCETLYRCPVYGDPQIWAPLLIETADPARAAEFRLSRQRPALAGRGDGPQHHGDEDQPPADAGLRGRLPSPPRGVPAPCISPTPCRLGTRTISARSRCRWRPPRPG